MLEVFIVVQLRVLESGSIVNSHNLEYWNQAQIQVNRIIKENFPMLPQRDDESLRERLKCLRRNPKVSNFSSLTSEDNFL